MALYLYGEGRAEADEEQPCMHGSCENVVVSGPQYIKR